MLRLIEYATTHPFLIVLGTLAALFLLALLMIGFLKGGKIRIFGIEIELKGSATAKSGYGSGPDAGSIPTAIPTFSSRKAHPHYLDRALATAESVVRLVFVNGGFLSPVQLTTMIDTHPHLRFEFFLLDPQSPNRARRREDTRVSFAVGQEGDGYTHILDAARARKTVAVFYYDDYPFWHYVQIDNRRLLVSYNPIGRLGYDSSPIFEFVNGGTTQQLYAMFAEHVWLLVSSARAVVPSPIVTSGEPLDSIPKPDGTASL